MELILSIAAGIVLGVGVLKGMHYKLFWQALGVVAALVAVTFVLKNLPQQTQARQSVSPVGHSAKHIDWSSVESVPAVE